MLKLQSYHIHSVILSGSKKSFEYTVCEYHYFIHDNSLLRLFLYCNPVLVNLSQCVIVENCVFQTIIILNQEVSTELLNSYYCYACYDLAQEIMLVCAAKFLLVLTFSHAHYILFALISCCCLIHLSLFKVFGGGSVLFACAFLFAII